MSECGVCDGAGEIECSGSCNKCGRGCLSKEICPACDGFGENNDDE